MSSFTIGPKLPIIDFQADGSTYGENMRRVLIALQALLECNVINLTTSTPPTNPSNGDAYIVGPSPTGAWAGQANSVAYWTIDDPQNPTGIWFFYPPFKGWTLGNQADGNQYKYSGTAWVVFGASSGGGGIGFGGATHNLHIFNWGRSGVGIQLSAAYQLFGSSTSNTANNDPTATVPIFVTYTTNITGSKNLFSDTGATSLFGFTLGVLKLATAEAIVQRQTSSRFWIGCLSGNSALYQTELDQDTLSIPFAGFRLSDPAGDGNYQCVCADGVGQTTVDSGVANDGNPHVFQLVPNGSTNIQFYIDGVLVQTITTHLPSTSTGMNWCAYWDNNGTANVVTIGVILMAYETK